MAFPCTVIRLVTFGIIVQYGNGMLTTETPAETRSTASETPLPTQMTKEFHYLTSHSNGNWTLDWYGPPDMDPVPDAGNRTMTSYLYGNADCHIVMWFLRDLYTSVDKIKKAQLYRKTMTPLIIEVNFVDQMNGFVKTMKIEAAKFLKSSSRSDFKFLPWKMEHFNTISRFFIVISNDECQW